MKTAYFAGGCFWCITPAFKEMEGVINVISGYSGGDEVSPTYKEVKSQTTGHRETIRIDYDPKKVGFEELLGAFINEVDPFDGGGQFIDRGHSYTLAVYYNDIIEKETAERMISNLEETSGREVYIALEPFRTFYTAEEEHQDYYIKHPEEFERELIESGRKKVIPENKYRVIKIGKEALFEFIYEKMIDNQELYFDVTDGTSIVTTFDIDWETGEFIAVARSEYDEDKEHLQFDGIDTRKLLKNMKDTTETMFYEKRYAELDEQEIKALSE